MCYYFLGLVHTSYFRRVEFNSIKCGRNATVDSYQRRTCVELNSELILSGVSISRKCLLNVEYSMWRTEILRWRSAQDVWVLKIEGTVLKLPSLKTSPPPPFQIENLFREKVINPSSPLSFTTKSIYDRLY